MKLNRGGQPEARAQVEGPQVKYIKGLKIPPQNKHLNKSQLKKGVDGVGDGDST
jgi:hypothetical protein